MDKCWLHFHYRFVGIGFKRVSTYALIVVRLLLLFFYFLGRKMVPPTLSKKTSLVAEENCGCRLDNQNSRISNLMKLSDSNKTSLNKPHKFKLNI